MLVVIVQDAVGDYGQAIVHVDGKELDSGEEQAVIKGRVEAPVLSKGSVLWPGEHLPGAKDLYQSGVLEVVRSRAKDAHPGRAQWR